MRSPNPPRRRLALLAAATIVATLLGTLAVGVAPNPVGAEEPDAVAPTLDSRSTGEFYGLLNGYRASHGLAPLAVDGALASTAQAWATRMGTGMGLAHDPNLPAEISGWTKIAENVGTGGSVSAIWSSFLASPTHVANIIDPVMTHFGVGFYVDGRGQIWTTHRFMRVGGSTTPPAGPPPTAPPATAPPVTAPPTTAPPPPANPGDALDCTDVSLWVEANGWYLLYAPHYGDVAGLDPDGDGVPCEDLPGAPAWAQPTTTTTAAPQPASGGAGGNGGAGADGDGDGGDDEDGAGSPDPHRVAEVIDALRALPA
jgi:uncharacterized protein YkwD